MFKVFGYTDIQNPIYSFDLMNDSKFGYLKDCIENKSQIPEHYNANIIRLRDYRLGELINDFREMCNGEIVQYEDAWREYRAEYNTSMPEDFYHFWCLCDDITIYKILPRYMNLIDPVSMNWIDPEYSSVSVVNGIYQYKINKPIMTADPTFLYPETKVKYNAHTPEYRPILSICEELSEEVRPHLPKWLRMVESLHNELTHTEPEEGETETAFIKRTKKWIRNFYKDRS